MASRELAGHTVLAVTDDPASAEALAGAAAAEGVRLAVICPDPATVVSINTRGDPDLVGFACPAPDAGAWRRIAAGVEQRLGPIDAVVVDAPGRYGDDRRRLAGALADPLADLERRGGAVVTADPHLGALLPGGVRRVAAPPGPAGTATLAAALRRPG